MKGKKILILLNGRVRDEDIEKIRNDVIRQLEDGVVVVDGKVKDIIVYDESSVEVVGK